MYYTVYQITNIVNNKIYIGVHKTKNPNDEYMGSGKAIKNAIEKYGKENFIKTVLHIFMNKEDAFKKEHEIVTQDFINSGNTYNAKLGGNGGWDHVRTTDMQRLATENLKKFYQTEEGKQLREKVSNANKGRIPHNKGLNGYYHTTEAKQKISSHRQQTITITDGINEKHQSKSLPIPIGWKQGRANCVVKKCVNFQTFLLDDGETQIKITNLKKWCIDNNFSYRIVFAYIDKGPIKMIERYRSPEREWFIGKSLSRL